MLEPWLYPLLLLTGLAAGFVDSVAGGGGLLTLPVLLNLGLPAQDALGTNKLQATFGSGSAAWHFSRAGLVPWKSCFTGVLYTALGAGLGTALVRGLDPGFLQRVIPWLLVAIAIYFVLQPRVGEVDVRARVRPGVFHLACGLGLGFYDGFFGPGTGTFWAVAFTLGLGFNLTRATAHTKVMNFTSNLVSLAVFAGGGHMHLGAGVCMGVGQLAGAWLGTRVVLRRGARFIRPVLLVVTLAITARLFWKNFFPS